jgi:hypothetical protein
MQKSGDHG